MTQSFDSRTRSRSGPHSRLRGCSGHQNLAGRARPHKPPTSIVGCWDFEGPDRLQGTAGRIVPAEAHGVGAARGRSNGSRAQPVEGGREIATTGTRVRWHVQNRCRRICGSAGTFMLTTIPIWLALCARKDRISFTWTRSPTTWRRFLEPALPVHADIPSLFFTWQNINRRYPMPVRLTEKYVYNHTAHALAGSESARRVLRDKGFPSGITVVPQFGVDPDTFRPQNSAQRQFTVGFLNRLVATKGPMVAIDALAEVPPDIRMCIVGDGPLRSRIHATIKSHGLADRVDSEASHPLYRDAGSAA